MHTETAPSQDLATHAGSTPGTSHLDRWVGSGVSIASFAGFDDEDRFLVACGPGKATVAAASTICLRAEDIGTQVVVALEGGDANRPVILGRAHRRAVPSTQSLTVRVDGDKVLLQADREIELRCGSASLHLTRAGKVLIRGHYVSSRSTGANRIKGAYVDIN